MSLEERIIKFLLTRPNRIASDWEIANELYDNCMNKRSPSNGIRVANIRKIGHKSNVIIQIDEDSWSLSWNYEHD